MAAKQTFSDRLADVMAEQRLTQEILARRLSLSQATISRWLSGTIPHRQKGILLANALGVSEPWLIRGVGRREEGVAVGLDNTLPISGLTGHKAKKAMIAAQNEFPSRLRWLRQHTGMTISTFAAACGFGASYISRLENASRKNPSWKFVESLIATFGVSRQWLYYGAGEPFLESSNAPKWEQVIAALGAKDVRSLIRIREEVLADETIGGRSRSDFLHALANMISKASRP